MTISEGFDGPLHPLLWSRLPGSATTPAVPRNVEEALGMMERSHAAAAGHLLDEPVTDGETVPLSLAWFAAVREACARTGPVPGVERYLLEWWVTDPPAEDLTQLPWLIGVWQGRWVCWAGTTPWAAADQKVTTPWDRAAFEQAVRFNADPEHPPTEPWTILGTSQLAVPTVILLALAGKPATGSVRLPVTPATAPEPEVEPEPEVVPEPEVAAVIEPEPGPSLDVLEGRIPPPPGAPGAEGDVPEPEPALPATDDPSIQPEAETGAEAEPTEPETTAAEPEPETTAAESEAEPEADAAPEAEAEPEVAEPEVPTADDAPIAADELAPVAPLEPPTTPPAPTLPPASWYTDPTGRHQLRYWDGPRWTEHAADQATGQVIDPI